MKTFKNFEIDQLNQTEQQMIVGGNNRVTLDGVPINNTTTGGAGSASTSKAKKKG